MNFKDLMSDTGHPGSPPAYVYSIDTPSGGVESPPAYTSQYHQPYEAPKKSPSRVVDTQPMMVLQAPPLGTPPRDYMMLGIFTACCCNLILGCLAIWMSCKSIEAANDWGDYTTARKKGRYSLLLSIVGIIAGVATIVGVIVWYCVVFRAI